MLATVFTRVCEHKKSKNAKHCRIAYDGGRPAEQRDVRCKATTYIFFTQPCLHEFASIRKAKMRSIAGLLTMAGDLLRKEMFVALQRFTSSSHGIVKYYFCRKLPLKGLFRFIIHNIFTKLDNLCYIYINISINRGGK